MKALSELKLHIGCGKRNWPGWVHIDGGKFDHVKNHDVFIILDIDLNSVDIIYSAHLLEYFSRSEGFTLLSTWFNRLKPGGELRLAVPDFGAIAKLYHDKYYELEQFLGLLYGKMDMNGQEIYHKTVYDYRSLNRILAKVGFVNIQQVDRIAPINEDDHSEARLPHYDPSGTLMSLNIICNKP